ncbi:MAG TPA: hypothetical protein VHX61_15945 [Rhizomicrobium sp.]|nr:hypothetical protein [Rhizomicrobium sp.]
MAKPVGQSNQIVAGCGAGVTNVVFGHSGLEVLEMFGAHISSEGWLTTSGAGGRHFLLAGRNSASQYAWREGMYQCLPRTERTMSIIMLTSTTFHGS